MTSYLIPIHPDKIEGRELFPLPMTPMEKLMLWDDSTKYPKRIRCSMVFEGQIDEELLKKSLAIILGRHPLLLAQPNHRAKPEYWVIPDQPCLVFWGTQGSYFEPPDDYWVRLQDESNFDGFSVWIHRDQDNSELIIEYHHACCDGQGGRQFIGDLSAAYDQLWKKVATEEITLNKLDPSLLRRRNAFRKPSSQQDIRPTTVWEKIAHAYHFHCLPPHSIRQLSRTAKQDHTGVSSSDRREELANAWRVQRTVLDQNETALLQSRLQSDGMRMNDLGVATLLKCIHDWTGMDASDAKKRLRILVPADLRGIDDRRLPSANRFGFAFVVAQGGQVHSLENAATAIRHQLEKIRKLRLGLDFVQILGRSQQYRWSSAIARRLLESSGCSATAILTSMGDVTRRHRKKLELQDSELLIGNLRLTSLSGVPPLRPSTSFGVGLTMSSQRLSVSSVVDLTSLGLDALQLHDRYVDILKQWAVTGSEINVVESDSKMDLASSARGGRG